MESDAPLLNMLSREIVMAVLHRLDARSLAHFAATCEALYRHTPPQQESAVAVVLLERADDRGVDGAAGYFEVPGLLRRE